jgi:hypothetical protein
MKCVHTLPRRYISARRITQNMQNMPIWICGISEKICKKAKKYAEYVTKYAKMYGKKYAEYAKQYAE